MGDDSGGSKQKTSSKKKPQKKAIKRRIWKRNPAEREILFRVFKLEFKSTEAGLSGLDHQKVVYRFEKEKHEEKEAKVDRSSHHRYDACVYQGVSEKESPFPFLQDRCTDNECRG